MANIKVSDMTALTSLPDDAIFYVVLPDGSYGSVTKLELLSGVVGTSQLVDLTDVQIVSLVNGQSLVWDSVDSKWKNQTVALLSDLTVIQEGIAWKQPVELAFDTALSQSGVIPQLASLTNQGVTLVNDSRIILMAQANPVFNGIYRVNSTLVSGFYRLYRTNDANTTAELNNAVVGVTGGTHAGKTFRQTAVNPTIGTTAINFVEFGNSTVANATNILAGIAKLYNVIGTETDGGITPNAVINALASFKTANFLDFTSSGQTQLDALNPLLKRFYFDDFLNLGDNGVGVLTVNGATLQTEGGLSNIIKIGAGTQFTKMPSEANRDGILRAQVGNVNGNIRIRHSNLWIKSTDSVVFASNFRIQTLSTATERYFLDFRFFIDNNNFITCRYSDNVNSGNFQFITSNSGVTTTVNTSINVAINTWYELEIRIINGVATLFINGVAELPISTNILLNASYDCQWFLVKTVSQANAPRTVDFDYLLFKDL